MLTLLDNVLLRRPMRGNDYDVSFRRIDGDPSGHVMCFLPWNTSFRQARAMKLCPPGFLACYEMPCAIVSAEPEQSVLALGRVVDDACAVLARRRIEPHKLVSLGYSIGVFAAAIVAARCSAQLISVAGADRGDAMMWQSPAAASVKQRAMTRGYRFEDYETALRGLHPIDQISGVGPGSIFVYGTRDQFVPLERSEQFATALRTDNRQHRIIRSDTGHLGAMLLGGRMVRGVVGDMQPVRRPTIHTNGEHATHPGVKTHPSLERH